MIQPITEITVLYNDERDLHQSKIGKITTCRKYQR